MAGDWLPMRLDLATDPAVISISARVGLDEDTVVGKLHKLWSWANHHTENGNAAGVTESWLDRYINVSGFARAMLDAGWLLINDTGITIPKFDAWNSQTAKTRILTSKRVAKFRSEKCNDDSVTQSLPKERKGKESKVEERKESPPAPLEGGRNISRKKPHKKHEVSAEVLAIYDAYPRHTARGAAIKAIEKAIAKIGSDAPNAADANVGSSTPGLWLLKKVKEYAESRATEDQKFTPHPATWFNQERYFDETVNLKMEDIPYCAQ